jgi:hypothetical protein
LHGRGRFFTSILIPMPDCVKRFFTRAKGIRLFYMRAVFLQRACKKSDTLRNHVKNLPPPMQKNQFNSNV